MNIFFNIYNPLFTVKQKIKDPIIIVFVLTIDYVYENSILHQIPKRATIRAWVILSRICNWNHTNGIVLIYRSLHAERI